MERFLILEGHSGNKVIYTRRSWETSSFIFARKAERMTEMQTRVPPCLIRVRLLCRSRLLFFKTKKYPAGKFDQTKERLWNNEIVGTTERIDSIGVDQSSRSNHFVAHMVRGASRVDLLFSA